MSEKPKLDAAKRPNGLRSMADGMIYLAGQTGVETESVWKTVDILRAAADEMEQWKKERDEARAAIQQAIESYEKVKWGYDGCCGTNSIMDRLHDALQKEAAK